MGSLLSKDSVISRIRSMDPYEFEKFVAEIWEQRGFTTTVRSGSGDRGIDIIATHGEKKILIQVKRYGVSNKIGSQEVRKYATLYQQVRDADRVILVTSGFFTDEGRSLAHDLNVDPINIHKLYDMIESSAPSVAIEYLSGNNQPAESTEQAEKSKSGTKQSETNSNADSPFENQSQLAKVSPNQGFLDGCPECVSGKVWFGQENEEGENTLLMCKDCGAKWREVIEKKGLIFKRETRIGWTQISGKHRGQTKTMEEWEQL